MPLSLIRIDHCLNETSRRQLNEWLESNMTGVVRIMIYNDLVTTEQKWTAKETRRVIVHKG